MDNLPQRNAEIAQALGNGEKATELAARYRLSRSHVHRIGKAYRNTQQQAEQFQAGGNGRSNVGGNKFAEIGTTGLRRFGGDIDEDYDRVFRPLNKKLALFKEMADDPVVAAVLQAIRMTLRRVSWYVDPVENSDANKKAAEWLEGAKDDMSQSFSDTIDQVLNMMRDGFQPFEIVYKKRAGDRPEAGSKYTDGKIGWRKWIMLGTDSLAPGEPWTFDEHGGLQTINQMAAPDYKLVHIPVEKAILFRTTTDKSNPEGRALLRAMYQAWYIKKNLEEVEAISAERIGSGFPVAYLGSDVGKDLNNPNSDASLIQDALRNIRVDEQMGLLIPYAKMGGGAREGEGVLFEFVSPPGTKAIDLNAVIARYEQRIAMVGLAQFIHLGMNQVGARALGDSSQDFFTTALSGWADSIEDTINRYGAERLFRLNSFPGVKHFPRLRHDTVGQYTLSQLADYISKLAGVGILVPDTEIEKYLRTFANLPEKPIEVRPPAAPAQLPPKPPPGQPPQQLPEGEPNPDADAQRPEQAAEHFVDVAPGSIMIAFSLSNEMASKIALPDGESPRNLHITLALPGKVGDLSQEQLDRFPNVMRGFAMINRPLPGMITGLGEFAAHDGKKPVVALVDIPGLPAWRQRLVETLTLNGYTVATNHGYIPHITLKYADENEAIEFRIAPTPVIFDRIMLVMDDKRNTYRLGGGEPVEGTPETFASRAIGEGMSAAMESEYFADKRGGGPGRRSKPVQAVNAYQAELEHIYSDWSDNLATELADEESDRDEIIAAALLLLLTRLRDAGHKNITDALFLALDGEPPDPEMVAALAEALESNDGFLGDSFIPAVHQKLENGLRDEDIMAALKAGIGAAALSALLSTMTARVASYAGGWWNYWNKTVGTLAQSHGKKILAYLDPRAQHCDECPEFHDVGGREYASFDDYLATTGGRIPGDYQCRQWCRCELKETD